MSRLFRRSLAALAIALLCAGSASFTPPAPAAGESPEAGLGEVRLRKLHLVRPDLIPYPVAYEVYC
jgi:hypothetical protein